MVLDTIKNTNINDPNQNGDTPYLLKLKKVARSLLLVILLYKIYNFNLVLVIQQI
jgi:hypothetical protein